MIHNAAGQDFVAFLGRLEPHNWPECFQQLMSTLDSTDLDRQAAFNVLEKACEDYPRKLDVEINGTRPLDFMIPKFLMLADHPSAKMCSNAIACLSYFVPVSSQSLFVHLDNFIATLFKLASDDDPSVRRHVCQALILLLAARPEKLMPKMANVAEYMLYPTKDKNENVALEACEFWFTFTEDTDLAIHLHPLLDEVAPVLLDCMVYGRCGGHARPRPGHGHKAAPLQRWQVPQARVRCKQQCHRAPARTARRRPTWTRTTTISTTRTSWTTEWNAAAALDVLAVRLVGDLLNMFLRPLKEKLWSSDRLQRESGILVLGAMAEALELFAPESIQDLFSDLHLPSSPRRLRACANGARRLTSVYASGRSRHSLWMSRRRTLSCAWAEIHQVHLFFAW
ncbi:armadillo-type protein [Mycena leptocephala]|nr:armadillo-type protein [Mycena leptocephala]